MNKCSVIHQFFVNGTVIWTTNQIMKNIRKIHRDHKLIRKSIKVAQQQQHNNRQLKKVYVLTLLSERVVTRLHVTNTLNIHSLTKGPVHNERVAMVTKLCTLRHERGTNLLQKDTQCNTMQPRRHLGKICFIAIPWG